MYTYYVTVGQCTYSYTSLSLSLFLKQIFPPLSLSEMDLAGATSTVDSSSSSSSVSSTATSHDCDSPRGGDVDHELLRTTSVSVSVSLSSSSSASIQRVLSLIRSEDPDSRLFAAKEIRRLTKTSHRCRRHFSQAVEPLVSMLRFESPESHHEAALLALLNLAVKDEKYVTFFFFPLFCFRYADLISDLRRRLIEVISNSSMIG